jgi:hypothetical protein
VRTLSIQYEALIQEAYDSGLTVIEKHFQSAVKGLWKGNRIGIEINMPTVEKTCILGEEIGHSKTTVGNIIDQSKIENVKQELVARGWAYQKLLPVEDIKKAWKDGYAKDWDAAEHLDVSVEFYKEAIEYYRKKGLLY